MTGVRPGVRHIALITAPRRDLAERLIDAAHSHNVRLVQMPAEEQIHVLRDLLAEHVDLLLRGHLHEPDVVTVSSVDQTLRQIAAGGRYEGDMANAWPNACHLIDVTLDEAGRPLHYDLRMRGYSDRGAGFWFDDGSLSPSAPNGRLRWEAAGAERDSAKVESHSPPSPERS